MPPLQRLSNPTSALHIPQLVHAPSRQEDTATSSSVTTSSITWQLWKWLYPVVCERASPPHWERAGGSEGVALAVCTLSINNQDDPCQLPIDTHFPFWFYSFVLSTERLFSRTDRVRKWKLMLGFFPFFKIVLSNIQLLFRVNMDTFIW